MTETTTETNDVDTPMLSAVEARVLGVLMEKRRTTPDAYPLSLNALVQGCNQKTSRVPVMQLEAGQVGHVINQLRDRDLVYAELSTRVERYGHKLAGALTLDLREQALICALMLRGPQTPGELRGNVARLAEFDDLAQVQELLDALAARERPLVKRLPRESGRREERYAHLLCGDVVVEAAPETALPAQRDDGRIAALEQEVAALRAEVEALWRLTGLERERK